MAVPFHRLPGTRLEIASGIWRCWFCFSIYDFLFFILMDNIRLILPKEKKILFQVLELVRCAK
jgi:hypothetical protein